MRPGNGVSITVVLSVVLVLSGRSSSCLATPSEWSPNGVLVAPADSAQREPRIVPDGSGGVIIAWEDKRGGPSLAYAQHLTPDGSVASGWPVGGVLLPSRGLSQANLTAIADGAGGAFVACDDNDFRGAVMVHHLGADGTPASGWPSLAVALKEAPYGVPGGDQGAFLPALLTDGAGGVFVARTYRDRLYQSIALTRLTASSDFAPGWDSGAFAGAGAPWEYPSLLCSDGQGGVYAAFQENHVPPRILLDRFNGAGGEAFAAIAISSTSLDQTAPGLVSDGGTGAIVVWEDHRNGAFDQVYAQRMLSDGTVASGWSAGGINICAFPTAPGSPSDFVFPGPISSVISDGTGGAYVAWTDYRNDDLGDIYAQRVLGSGMIATGWPGNGLAVCTAPGAQERPTIAPDGSGGMIVTWQDRRNASDYDVYAQHLLPDGTIAPGWSVGGLALCMAAGDQVTPVVTTDSDGNAFFAWTDGRSGQSNIYAARVAVGQVPVGVEAPARANLALEGAVPNPALRGGLAVRFELPGAEPATIDVLDIGGRRLALRDVGALGAGSHTIDLRGAADFPAGVYLVRLTQARRTLVVKASVR